MLRETTLARAFVELADTLVDEFDVTELLTVLTDRCVDVLDFDAAGIVLAGPDGRLRVMASSTETMRILELFEIQTHEGPCLDCYESGEAVLVPDIEREGTPWPRFSAEAHAAGFRAVNALPLRLRGRVIGALNLFNATAGAMDRADLDAGQALADVATIAILQHRAAQEAQILNEQLSDALNTRIVIEQAKGMIAERRGVDIADAFAVLRGHARSNHLLLADLARAVVAGDVDAGTFEG